MDTTLAINPGSSTKKYAFYRNEKEVFSVRFEHVEHGFGKCVSIDGVQQSCEALTGVAYDRGLYECIDVALRAGVITHIKDIARVGIRVVAPHRALAVHAVVNDRYMHILESLKSVAPLHVPFILEELRIVREVLPHVPVVGVSDSAFHTTMSSCASHYSIAEEESEYAHLYRYGYHGLSVASVVRTLTERVGSLPERMLVVHAGSGASVTAVQNGKSVDTTMGFAPASGLIMSSRGGDIDASALLHIMRTKQYSIEEGAEFLNTRTGLMGLCGTNDLRIVLDRARRGDRHARRAEEAYVYHIHKALGALGGLLGGIDALVLTATVNERNPYVRSRIARGCAHFGVEIDEELNDALPLQGGCISKDHARVAVWVIPTEEMREIALVAESYSA